MSSCSQRAPRKLLFGKKFSFHLRKFENMGKELELLGDAEKEFVLKQHLFFIGSSPLSAAGKVNLSPKGHRGSFGFLSQELGAWSMDQGLGCRKVEGVENEFDSMEPKGYFAYLDFGGSGTETICHLRENGRMTVMFCSFDGPPKILRFFGRGVSLSLDAVENGEDRKMKIDKWNRMVGEIDPSGQVLETFHSKIEEGKEMKMRSLIIMEIFRIRDSCGFAVPVMPFKENRTLFPSYYDALSKAEFDEMWINVNRQSLDGLPGLYRVEHADKHLISASYKPRTPPSIIASSPPPPPPSSKSRSKSRSDSPSSFLVPVCGGFVIGVVVGLGITSWIAKK